MTRKRTGIVQSMNPAHRDSEPNGISANVSDWLVQNIDGVKAPFTFAMIAGGHSNLTFAVIDANGRRLVLRRPPLGHRLASAHDMAREFRLISAMNATNVPVPRALGLCTDESVNELPFYVMDFVDGHIIRDIEAAGNLLTPAARRRAGESLVDNMVLLHAVDPDEVGLGDLARKDAYIERQLKRWYANFKAQQTRDLPGMDLIHDELSKRIPPQHETTIVHGDYRLDNCMLNDDGDVVAVLDWEICTLGDPLADIGMLMVYWNGPGDDTSAWSNPTCTLEGFLGRSALAARYGEKSGRDMTHFDFYVTYGYWKLGCIIEGVYARYLGGALGQRDPEELEPFKVQVDNAVIRATTMLEKLR